MGGGQSGDINQLLRTDVPHVSGVTDAQAPSQKVISRYALLLLFCNYFQATISAGAWRPILVYVEQLFVFKLTPAFFR